MSACTIRRDTFHGWDACILENAYARLVAVPDIGGRIMAFDLGPYPFLYANPQLAGRLFTPEEHQGDGTLGAWKNYGGDKTWPAPQGWDHDGQWHGPPDPVLDSGRYTLDRLVLDGGRAVIAMTSPPDPRTGLQITRQFTLFPGGSRVRADLTFANVSARVVRWSIWDVVQLRAERRLPDGGLAFEPACTLTAPLNPASVFPRGFNVMFGAADNSQWQPDPQTGLFFAPYQWQIGKVGLDSPAGWIAFSNAAAGYAFIERFEVVPGAEYPDGGATVEIWTVGAGQVGNLSYEGSDMYHMEAEVLGPLRTLAPGGTSTFAIEWGACRCPGAVIAASEGGCLSAPLALEPVADGYGRVTASGGVFFRGELWLVWEDERRRELSARSLGPADPLTVVALDRIERVPGGARHLALQLDVAGERLTLAELALG